MTRKNLVAAISALAVLALVVAIAVVASRGGEEPARSENQLPAAHSSPGQTQPDPGDQPTGSGWNDQGTDPSGVHGGNTMPGYPGTDGGGSDSGGPPAIHPGGPMQPVGRANTIAVANAHLDGQGQLVLGYFVGLPSCYAQLDHVETLETGRNITVTLVRGADPQVAPGVACPDIAMSKSVRVALTSPLGQRSLIDGSTGQRVRVH